MIQLADNKYRPTLSRSIKVYMTKGTLEKQQQAKATTTQPTSTLTTSTFTSTATPQPTNTSTFIPFTLSVTPQPITTIQQLHAQPMDEENHSTTTTGYGKEITNIAKIYIKEQKYSGINESLNYKLIIFYNIYNQADIL